MSVGAASQWLFNFMMSQVTPHAIANIEGRMFLMFAIVNYAILGSWRRCQRSDTVLDSTSHGYSEIVLIHDSGNQSVAISQI